ncbi:unnamed protein product [Lactuca saligna]|uniref:non-specific serine/threonine protein kinase n=1 Tax=Lactuca saligna TaxID=75948 RepID=A0AA35Z3W9_LACSI|nr:unnamed protein product [Lactuca saligna]
MLIGENHIAVEADDRSIEVVEEERVNCFVQKHQDKDSPSSQVHVAVLSQTLTFLFFLFFSNGAVGVTFTIVNECGFTIWPAIISVQRLNETGFELTKGDCDTNEFLECDVDERIPPATTADFSINQSQTHSPDFYDVNMALGYNLPILVEATSGSADGKVCMSACLAFGSPEYCCSDSFSSPSSCKPTAYAQLFRSACPRSYSTSYDLQATTFLCNGADYTIRFCASADSFSTIKLDSELKSTDQLVSRHGNFTLGFFGEDYSYLGIWYTRDVQSTKVWVANPNAPIISSSGAHTLSISAKTGDLIITAGGTTLMSITNVKIAPNANVTATLEDNGNFRLINQVDKRVLWQSFVHPTNVLLPGMKLGYDMTTGQNWTLTSWLNNENPKSGPFTLSWEPTQKGSQGLMIRRRGRPYWTSGILNNQIFQYMFSLNGPSSQSMYNLTSVYNNKARYFSYDSNIAALPMWILTPKGQIRDINSATAWSPEFCYGYDSGNGCILSSLPQCRTENDNFSKKNGDFAQDKTKSATDGNSSLSINDCFVKCWNDCNCVGFSSSTINGSGCVVWTGINSFLVNPHENSTSKYVISQNLGNLITGNKTQKSKNWIWISISVSITFVFLCFGALWYIKKRKRRQKEYERRKRDEYFVELTTSESFKDVHRLESDGVKGNDLLLFSFASIMAATNDFSVENKLGQGGFGPVYKGKLSDGREIAIKRLSRTSRQGLVEFKNELVLIAKLQHTNLVRVLGCCIHGEEKMLIYEYMPNKSLDFFVFDENRKAELDWPKRFIIIEGIAQGLLYLHKYSRMKVIHRDLKANNILLDERMNPKISDFGMARICEQNETEAMTNRVVGTYGYMSPEYAMRGIFSIKSDIFSFGVLILEIVSGRRNSSFVHLHDTYSLIGYAWVLWQQGDTLEFKDPTLGNTCDVQQFLRTVHVALLCVQENAVDRPTTSEMISMLLNESVSLPIPNRPTFLIGGGESKSTSYETKAEDFSVNNVTISDVGGR